MDKELILKTVREQERICLATRERQQQLCSSYSNTMKYERAKLIGMLDILDALKIDRTEFNWIFNI